MALFLALSLAGFDGRPLAVILSYGVRTFLPLSAEAENQRLSGLLPKEIFYHNRLICHEKYGINDQFRGLRTTGRGQRAVSMDIPASHGHQ